MRSSIFLPFGDLGLVIVDEEHETSYKQYDPAPRYHARNAAIVLASMHGAKTLLGTATPAIETYFNARQGKYGLVELKSRFNDVELPEIIPVDVRECGKRTVCEEILHLNCSIACRLLWTGTSKLFCFKIGGDSRPWWNVNSVHGFPSASIAM